MNTEAKPSVRRDALVATFTLGILGLLWIVFRLYWQGLLLLAAASAVGYLGVRRALKRSSPPQAEPPTKRTRPDKPRRAKKRKRRK